MLANYQLILSEADCELDSHVQKDNMLKILFSNIKSKQNKGKASLYERKKVEVEKKIKTRVVTKDCIIYYDNY